MKELSVANADVRGASSKRERLFIPMKGRAKSVVRDTLYQHRKIYSKGKEVKLNNASLE